MQTLPSTSAVAPADLCMTCKSPITHSSWRKDGGVSALCDSCANYSKMNGLRGMSTSAGAAGGAAGAVRRDPSARRTPSSSVSIVLKELNWVLWGDGQGA